MVGFTGPLLTHYTADGPLSACWDSVGPTHCPGKTLTVKVEVSLTHKHTLLLTAYTHSEGLSLPSGSVVCCVDLVSEH